MTDPVIPDPALPPNPAPRAGRGLKVAFALSLALNLAVAGMVAGAWLGGGRPGHDMPRDLSFGPFSDALSPEDRRALRGVLFDRRDEFRANRDAAKAEFETLLTALRADPFDPAALQGALGAIVTRNAGRLELGADLIAARLADLSDADRLAFADRLEDNLRRPMRD